MAKVLKFSEEARGKIKVGVDALADACLLYTSDAADE